MDRRLPETSKPGPRRCRTLARRIHVRGRRGLAHRLGADLAEDRLECPFINSTAPASNYFAASAWPVPPTKSSAPRSRSDDPDPSDALPLDENITAFPCSGSHNAHQARFPLRPAFESSDDAFIAARQFAIAPEVSGYITAVPVTDQVRTGLAAGAKEIRTHGPI
jgi:hypothetical protein